VATPSPPFPPSVHDPRPFGLCPALGRRQLLVLLLHSGQRRVSARRETRTARFAWCPRRANLARRLWLRQKRPHISPGRSQWIAIAAATHDWQARCRSRPSAAILQWSSVCSPSMTLAQKPELNRSRPPRTVRTGRATGFATDRRDGGPIGMPTWKSMDLVFSVWPVSNHRHAMPWRGTLERIYRPASLTQHARTNSRRLAAGSQL